MIKYRDLTYVGEVTFEAIKSVIMKDKQLDEIRYSFMLHFDDSEDNTDPKNAAIISWVEQRICDILQCKSRQDGGPDDIIFFDFTSRAGTVWDRLDMISGRTKLVELGINNINVTTKVYNLTTM